MYLSSLAHASGYDGRRSTKPSECRDLLMPAQLMFGKSDVNARASGLPLVALRSLAMQASIGVAKMYKALLRRPARNGLAVLY
jgi:hypothetical protein